MQKGAAPQALPFLETAAKLNPDEAAVWFQLARVYQALGRKAEATAARARYSAMREESLEKSQPVLPPSR